MHALAQIMAASGSKDKPTISADPYIRVKYAEHNYMPGEFDTKPQKFCTPDSPCYNIPRGTIWEAMGGPSPDRCTTCTQVIDEVNEFVRDFNGWTTTKGGKFELWCAKTQRQKTTPSPSGQTSSSSTPHDASQ